MKRKWKFFDRFKFRDFFRAYLNILERKKISTQTWKEGEKNSFSFSAFFFQFFFQQFLFQIFFYSSFPDGVEIYIKQAPLVIINERMNYCEFNFFRFVSFRCPFALSSAHKGICFQFSQNATKMFARTGKVINHKFIQRRSLVGVKWLIFFTSGQLNSS